MFHPTHETALDLFPHPKLDSEDPQISEDTYWSLVRQVHSLCCSCSLLVPLLTAQLGSMFRPVLHVAPAWPRASLPVTLQTHKVTKPRSHHTTNAISPVNDISHGAADRPSESCRPSYQYATVRSPVRCSLFGISTSTLALRCACLPRLRQASLSF